MKSKVTAGLYVLLIVFAAFSMGYYIAGALALREEFFHASRYVSAPFDFHDDGQTLDGVRKEATVAGLSNGDFLLAVNGVPFTGYAQIHDLLQHTNPGQIIEVSARTPSGKVREVQIRLASRKSPNYSIGGYIAFLTPILGVPLLGLLIGYWVVAARPRDLNAWLVFLLLAFPETAFGNLDWKFWPSPWYLVLFVWNSLVQAFVFPALVWFGFLFPERWRVELRLPWLKYAVLAAFFCIFIFESGLISGQFFSVDVIRSLAPLQLWVDRADSWLQVICILLFLAALFDKLRSASTADARRRLRVLAIGSALSLGPLVIIFTVVPWFGMDPHYGKWFSTVVPFISIFPLTLAYVLIVQRAMDVRILLRMGTKYLLARATVLIVEVVLVAFLILRFIVPMMQRKEPQLLNFLLLALCIGVLFQVFILRDSFSRRLQRWLDRKFFREAYNSEVVLSELAEQVRQLTDRNALFDIVLRRISEVLHVSQIAILLRGSSVFHLQQALGMDFGGAVALPEESATIQNLLRTNQPATLYRDRPEEWFTGAGAEEKALLRGIHAELLLPMSGRAHLIGLIALGPKKSEEPYTPTDLRTLQSVAAQTGLTLEVAELVRTLADQAAQRERMNREIEIAREVQQRLFPQRIPKIAGVGLAGMCRPASEVGGDYYDLIEMEDGHLGFAIGDVSGKGISAALIMASLRASLRGLILDDPGDLAKLMQKVNRLVYEASSSSRYATFFFAILDPQTREFRYVNAGHNSPVLVKQLSGELRRLEACGPVVGLLPFAVYETVSLILEPGDLLIAYTDGVSEAMTAEDEEWGETRMLEAVPRRPSASAAEVLEQVFHAADEFTAGAEQHDDMTLLIMKINVTLA
jgi:sigma-B regulation protein RsbU (phosphoserine phosphatase)